MTIENFDVVVKKYDPVKNVVFANLIVLGTIEIRGFQVRFTQPKNALSPKWIVSPPSTKTKTGTYIWIVEIQNRALWKEIESLVVKKTKEFVQER